MGASAQRVNAFEAKTRLSALLRETEAGKSFVITRRGKEVARLLPPEPEERAMGIEEIVAAFREIRDRVRGPLKIREFIEEGRRF